MSAAEPESRSRGRWRSVARQMVHRARSNVPGGLLVCADILAVDFPPASFDAIVAFYSVSGAEIS